MKLKILLSLLFLSILSFSLQAQKGKKDKDVQIIDFGADDNEDKPQSEYKGIIIKTNPVSFVFGAQWVEFEKEITDYLSLQMGLGVTFKSIIGVTYNELIAELDEVDQSCNSDQWFIDECDDYSDDSYRETTAGPLFSFSPRFFYESDGFDGLYLAPVLRFSTSKYNVQQIEESFNTYDRVPNAWQKETVRNIDLVIHYGYQNLHPKLSSEFFMGIGARFSKSTRQDIGQDMLGVYRNGERSFKETLFRIEAGIRLGFQL